MSAEQLPMASLRFGFSQIPDEGMHFRFEERFSELSAAASTKDLELQSMFLQTIGGELQVFRVGSKVDVRGYFETRLTGVCDRCMAQVNLPVRGDLNAFLVPQTQFSKHDKPGGKVIHAPTKGGSVSRHHSRSKAKELTDADGEHEDLNFGVFDGNTVDLRPLLREELVLLIPMRILCPEGKCERPGPESSKPEEKRTDSESSNIGLLGSALRQKLEFKQD